MVIEFDWLKKNVNNMLIAPDWLNMVDGVKTKLLFKLTKYNFVAACLDTRYYFY